MARPPNRLFNLVFEAPRRKSLGADSEEKRSDIDTGVVDSLKVLDPDGRLEKRPNCCALITVRAHRLEVSAAVLARIDIPPQGLPLQYEFQF